MGIVCRPLMPHSLTVSEKYAVLAMFFCFSITIEEVTVVVDCGHVKMTSYDTRSDTETLAPVVISSANVSQRAGRAGR